jgi:hypothetical protein
MKQQKIQRRVRIGNEDGTRNTRRILCAIITKILLEVSRSDKCRLLRLLYGTDKTIRVDAVAGSLE